MKNDFNTLKVSELEKVHDDLIQELRDLRFREVVGELNNPVKKRILRRSIARAKTLLQEYSTGKRKPSEV
jgi:large subunit ribosomal protein L29